MYDIYHSFPSISFAAFLSLDAKASSSSSFGRVPTERCAVFAIPTPISLRTLFSSTSAFTSAMIFERLSSYFSRTYSL